MINKCEIVIFDIPLINFLFKRGSMKLMSHNTPIVQTQRRSAWRIQRATGITARWPGRPVDVRVWTGSTSRTTPYRRRWLLTTSSQQKTSAGMSRSPNGMDLHVSQKTKPEWFDWKDATSPTAVRSWTSFYGRPIGQGHDILQLFFVMVSIVFFFSFFFFSRLFSAVAKWMYTILPHNAIIVALVRI